MPIFIPGAGVEILGDGMGMTISNGKLSKLRTLFLILHEWNVKISLERCAMKCYTKLTNLDTVVIFMSV